MLKLRGCFLGRAGLQVFSHNDILSGDLLALLQQFNGILTSMVEHIVEENDVFGFWSMVKMIANGGLALKGLWLPNLCPWLLVDAFPIKESCRHAIANIVIKSQIIY